MNDTERQHAMNALKSNALNRADSLLLLNLITDLNQRVTALEQKLKDAQDQNAS